MCSSSARATSAARRRPRSSCGPASAAAPASGWPAPGWGPGGGGRGRRRAAGGARGGGGAGGGGGGGGRRGGLLRARGLPAAAAAARQLTPDLVRAADLVLTMTTQQRAAVVAQVPSAVRRTFTLREFADLAALVAPEVGAGGPVARLRALVQAAPRARARREAGPGHDDVEDPFRRPEAVHARALAAIDDAVATLLAALGRPRSDAA